MVALLLAFAVSPAAAQSGGKGQGKGKKSWKQGPTVPGTGVRQFGVWLDDATMLPQGRAWATLSAGYWESPFGHQWDAPGLDLGLAVNNRLQVGIAAPFSRVSYVDGSSASGLGDVYFTSKIGLVAPAARGRSWGLAVAPVVEVLSSNSAVEGQSRVQWALPLTVERRFSSFRAYGTAGYFSRGAVFGSGAVELPLSPRWSATGSLSYSWSTAEDPLSEAEGLARSRWDVNGGVVFSLSSTTTLFASLGRTVSRMDANATSLAVSGGVSFGVERFRWRP